MFNYNSDIIFYKSYDYIFLRFNYINQKEFKNFKKLLIDNNLNLVFFSKKNLKKFKISTKNEVDFGEFKNSKMYYIHTKSNANNLDVLIQFKLVNNLLNLVFKNSSYNLLSFKFKNDLLRPYNKNFSLFFNSNKNFFNLYIFQIFFLLDFIFLFFK